MSDLKVPGEDKKKVSPVRIVIWILLLGVGVYLLATGIVGIVVKG